MVDGVVSEPRSRMDDTGVEAELAENLDVSIGDLVTAGRSLIGLAKVKDPSHAETDA